MLAVPYPTVIPVTLCLYQSMQIYAVNYVDGLVASSSNGSVDYITTTSMPSGGVSRYVDYPHTYPLFILLLPPFSKLCI